MKTKIKEAITQGYKNLGVPETVVDGLAALGVTVVKEESEIAAFVQSEAVKGVMKSYQSETDKVRTEYSTKLKGLEKEKADLEAKLNGNNQSQEQQQQSQQSQGEDNQQTETMPAWAQAIIDSNKALSDELASFKGEQSAKAALAAAESTFRSNDYVKKYADEANDAWEMTNEIRKYNPNWSAEEIVKDAMSRFNKAVGKKGVDTTQPFKSDGGGSDNTTSRFEAMAKRQQERQGAVAGE